MLVDSLSNVKQKMWDMSGQQCVVNPSGNNGLDSVRQGSHVLSIYDDELCHVSILAHIINKRINKGYRFIFISSVYTEMRMVEALGKHGTDVEQIKAGGELSFFPWFYPGDIESCSSDFSGRLSLLIGDQAEDKKTVIFYFINHSIISKLGKKGIIMSEAILDRIATERNIIIICLYDRSKFSIEFMADILRVHGHLMVKASFYRNIDYTSPEKVIEDLENKQKNFDLYLDSIVSRANLENALIECSQNCQRKVEDRDRELSRKEDVLRNIVDNTADAVVTRDVDLKVTSWNRSAERIMGYRSEEVLGLTVDDLREVYSSFPEINSYLQRALNGETFVDVDATLSNRNGIRSHVSASISPIRDYDGTVIGIISMIRDITERKKSEQSLKRLNRDLGVMSELSMMLGRSTFMDRVLSGSLDTLMGLMDADSGMVHILDEDNGVLNLKVRRGLSEESMCHLASKDISKGIIGSTIIRREPVCLHHIKHGMYSMTKDGRRVDLKSCICIPLISSDRAVGVITLGRSTDKEWSAEDLKLLKVLGGQIGIAADNARLYREILETRDFLKNVIDNSADAISSFDTEGRVMIWNRASEDLFKVSREEAIGRVFPSMIADRDKGLKLLEHVRNGKIFKDMDTTIDLADGSVIDISSTVSPLYGASGEFMGMLAITRDISERKKLETQLIEAKKEAELYVDLMSHDINNLNHLGMGYLEMLKFKNSIPDDMGALVDKAVTAFSSSARIIASITRFKEMRSWAGPREKVDLGQVLGDVVSAYSGNGHRPASIEYTPVEGRYVCADQFLKDVFLNMIGNSIKYCREDPSICISIDDFREGSREFYRVAIEDNGIGIYDEDKSRIFGRCERCTDLVSGAGLGLYIVKSLIDRYEGRIWVENRIKGDHSQGSRFIVLLEKSE